MARVADKASGEGSLTPKQEAFAQAVAAGKSQADAYREAFNVRKTTKPETIWEQASKLMADPKVRTRVDAIRAEITARTVETTAITIEYLTTELKEAVRMAKDNNKAAELTAAVMAIGKLHGLIIEKRENTNRNLTVDELDDAELARIATGNARAGSANPSAQAPSTSDADRLH